jgi:hypothetical protein
VKSGHFVSSGHCVRCRAPLELGVPAVIVPEHMVFGLGYGSNICLGSVLEMVAVCASCASPEEAAGARCEAICEGCGQHLVYDDRLSRGEVCSLRCDSNACRQSAYRKALLVRAPRVINMHGRQGIVPLGAVYVSGKVNHNGIKMIRGWMATLLPVGGRHTDTSAENREAAQQVSRHEVGTPAARAEAPAPRPFGGGFPRVSRARSRGGKMGPDQRATGAVSLALPGRISRRAPPRSFEIEVAAERSNRNHGFRFAGILANALPA